MIRLRFGAFVAVAALLTAAAGCASSTGTNAANPGRTSASAPPAKAAGGTCDWQQAQGSSATGLPPTTVPHSGNATMTIVTNRGTIEIQLNRTAEPCTVASFAYLGDKKFFDKTPCHRLTTDGIFVLQCGDPTGTGTGGPAYTIPDEGLPPPDATGNEPTVTYPRGTIAMANTGQPHSGGSQFFLVYKDSTLPYAYTKFGTITQGIGILDDVAKAGVAPGGQSPVDGAPAHPVQILSLRVS